MNNEQLKTVILPQKLFESMFEAYRKWEEFSEEFEDFLLASDKKFIKKMRKARKEHLKGKVKDLVILKQKLK
jgi:hypothetical protein